MKPTQHKYTALLPLALSVRLLTLTAPAQAQANGAVANGAYPTVVVNQQTVQFPGQPPIEQNGHVLVPLRGVLEKLGAYVDFDAKSNTVVAFRAGKRITLPIGAPTATVNDQPVHLDIPAAVVNGSTMVPLRFVAQALGAGVNFDVGSDTIFITMTDGGAGGSGVAAAPAPNPVADAERARAEAEARARTEAQRKADAEQKRIADAERQRLASINAVVGTVVAVYTDVSPQRIVVHVPAASGSGAGTDRTITLRGDTRIAVQMPNTPEQPIALSQVNAGDLVSVLQNGDGQAVAVNRISAPKPRNPPAVSGVFKGEFLDYTEHGDHYVLQMTDNRTIEVPRNVPVTYDNQQIGADDLRSGDDLTIAVDPVTHRGTRIIIAVEQ